jgi:antitoxin component YwqK of YwqJK toxin-antitoxin module
MKKALALATIFVLVCSFECFAKTVKGYYPGGNLKFIDHYNSKNELNGWYKFYYPNGQLKEQGQYKNGKIVGTIKKYYLDGSPITQ